jgi:hypothetical protein
MPRMRKTSPERKRAATRRRISGARDDDTAIDTTAPGVSAAEEAGGPLEQRHLQYALSRCRGRLGRRTLLAVNIAMFSLMPIVALSASFIVFVAARAPHICAQRRVVARIDAGR